MKLLTFLEQESSVPYKNTILMATIAAITECILLAMLNNGAANAFNGELLVHHLLIYIFAFGLFMYSLRHAISNTVAAIEDALFQCRGRICRKLSDVDLIWLEQKGRDQVYDRLTKDTVLISQSAPMLTFGLMSFLLLLFAGLYLATISPVSFLVAVFMTMVFAVVYVPKGNRVKKKLEKADQKDASYFQSLRQLLDGFKELKINRVKTDALQFHLTATATDASDFKAAVGKEEGKTFAIGRLFMYFMMPVLVFLVPLFYAAHSADIYQIVAILLFLGAPLGMMLNIMPTLRRIDVVIDDLYFLEKEIDAATREQAKPVGTRLANFHSLQLEELVYSYWDADGETSFQLGPISEVVMSGELLFIVGGNGSGKSTLLKLLVGLYFPDGGRLILNGREIGIEDYPAYRELFSIVFTDFHLFDRLYGFEDKTSSVNYWLERMNIQHKTKYRDGSFSHLDLSTGQRKRLAFIAAMLEDRPILVLDEFAADQDPQFRDFFYDTLLPELKSSGKTVIAVSHDDRYFHLADRVIKLDFGKIVNG